MASTEGPAETPPWHARYPEPKLEAGGITREQVLALLRDSDNVAGKDFVLVDLRRNDHKASSKNRRTDGRLFSGGRWEFPGQTR